MTYDEAMHTECEFCGEQAQWHRMTDAGNFYCLTGGSTNNWRKGYFRNRTPAEERQWAMTRAKCNDLHKSRSLSSMKGLSDIIIQNLRRLPTPTGEQLAL